MLKLAHKETPVLPVLSMPLPVAAYCADCEALFDIRQRRSCPACASETIVPVASLMNRWNVLHRTAKVG